MKNPKVWAGGVAAVLAFCAAVVAEVPPLPKDKLEKEAGLVVTGKVTKAETTEVRPEGGGEVHERLHRLTVQVATVHKGKPKDPAKSVVARGETYVLKPGHTGSGGHYAGNASLRVSAVKEGWELKLYLKPGKDGEYDIVFPNGFEVVKRPEAKKDEAEQGGRK